MRGKALTLFLAVAALPALSACQSTQSRSAELEAKGGKVLLNDKGLSVKNESTDVKVIDSIAFSDVNGGAAVVTVQNTSEQDLENVPISIDVLDKKGKSVFKNNLPGLEPALVSIPFIKAGEKIDWVNDQVLAVGATVASVKVKIGTVSPAPLPELPKLDVGQPKLATDPVSGMEAVGQVINRSGAEQKDLLLYAIARKGKRIVAAGRGLIAKLKDTTKPVDYHIFFIGDPKGAQVTVTSFPSLEKESK